MSPTIGSKSLGCYTGLNEKIIILGWILRKVFGVPLQYTRSIPWKYNIELKII